MKGWVYEYRISNKEFSNVEIVRNPPLADAVFKLDSRLRGNDIFRRVTFFHGNDKTHVAFD